MSGIKYTSMNEELTTEEKTVFVELLVRMVRWAEGGINGMLGLINEETGETMTVHLDAHDAVLCEMHKLEALDESVGSTIQ